LPFSEREFEKATVFMGSGGKVINKKVIFATPTHTLERIFTIKNENSLYVSNSLSFVLSVSKNEMDPSYIAYQSDYDSITLGLDKYVKSSPSKNSGKVEYFCHCNIEVDKELQVRRVPKNKVPDFKDFHDYRNLLVSSIRDIANNALSEHRARRYKLLATASSGYDSSCVAALAHEAGCRDVFTIRNARPKDQIFGKYRYNRQYSDDSGETVAKTLEYENIIVRDRWSYLDQKTDIYEAEACASGNLYYDPIIIFEDDIKQNVLLTGHNGGTIWTTDPQKSNVELKGGGLSGASICESRLRIGFIHAPIPYIGSCRFPSMNRITLSGEMSPWMLGTHYDRPIPRRILEEKGVPRTDFAIKKKAVGIILTGSKSNIVSKMSPESTKSFLRYHEKHKHKRNLFRQLAYDLMTGLYLTPKVIHKVGRQLRIPITGKLLQQFMHQHCFKFSRSPRCASFLLPWGVSIVKDRYKPEKVMNQENFS